MDSYLVLPDRDIENFGPVSKKFLELGVATFRDACRYIRDLPYGRPDHQSGMMTLFTENCGNCTTKHAVIASLAEEVNLPVQKNLGIYPLTEDLVTGTDQLLKEFSLPYVPMLHCFLVFERYQVDLTEGNRNGKKRPIETFLYVQHVNPEVSAAYESFIYRKAVIEVVLKSAAFSKVDLKHVLLAREQAIRLLRANIDQENSSASATAGCHPHSGSRPAPLES